MEFWGVEVKPGETIKCDPGDEKYLHLSQASLGEIKKDKGSENVPIYVKFDDKKLVLGTLSAEKCAQISYDLVFEKEFELSHTSKSTSVYFFGYKTVMQDEDPENFLESDFDSEEDIQLGEKANGKSVVKNEQAKPTTGKANAVKKAEAPAAKPKVKVEESNEIDRTTGEDDEDEDDEEVDSEDESDADEDMVETGDDSDDEDEDDSSEEDEATPKKTETGKRPAGSASKTPVPEKKAKLITPIASQKTGGDGKKGGHIATPHPAKQFGKTPASNDKSKQQTPKSPGSVPCKSCSKTFNSENALQAHTKAKHDTAK